jgi:hypothetical protein
MITVFLSLKRLQTVDLVPFVEALELRLEPFLGDLIHFLSCYSQNILRATEPISQLLDSRFCQIEICVRDRAEW